MKYIIAALIILLIYGCTTVVEETSKPYQEPIDDIIQEETKTTEQTLKKTQPVEIPENNVIKIGYTDFEPDYAFFNRTKTVIWENLDDRQHMIACYYYGGGRVFVGEKLEKGGKTEHTFEEHGTYICVDAIYGYRGTVVIYKMPVEHLSPITGGVIALPTTKINLPIAWPVSLLITLSILFVYLALMRRI